MKLNLSILCFALAINANAQIRVPSTQELGNPTNMFPALAGWHGGTQITGSYYNQWPGIPDTRIVYGLSGDTYVPKLHSAFGLNVAHNRTGTGIVNINSVDLNWAPKLSTKIGLHIMPSISIGYFQVAIDWAQTTFAPPGSPNPWPSASSGGMPATSSVNKLTLSSGVALAYENAFFVANVADISEPDLSFFPVDRVKLPRTYSAMVGRVFRQGNWRFTPRLVYHRWSEFNTLNLGVNVQYKQFYFGSNYSWGDMLGFAAGVELKNQIRMSYAYDFTTSRLGTQTLGSHQLVMRILLNKNRSDKMFLSNLPLL